MAADRPIRELMSAPVLTLRPEQTLEEAIAQLAERGISGAPVVDASGRLIGLLDDTDLILSEARVHAPTTIEILGAYFTLPGEQHRFQEELRAALAGTVADAMEEDVLAVREDGLVGDAATIIVDREVSRVPVVDVDRRVVGIVTRGDLVRGLSTRR